MKNEEKADEISGHYSTSRYFPNDEERAAYDAAIQMAEWKDQQFAEEKKKLIEKALGWLNEVVEDEQSKYVWYDNEEGFCGITEELVKDFKQAMEEQL